MLNKPHDLNSKFLYIGSLSFGNPNNWYKYKIHRPSKRLAVNTKNKIECKILNFPSCLPPCVKKKHEYFKCKWSWSHSNAMINKYIYIHNKNYTILCYILLNSHSHILFKCKQRFLLKTKKINNTNLQITFKIYKSCFLLTTGWDLRWMLEWNSTQLIYIKELRKIIPDFY